MTVLFADLVGYTALCSELDVEEVHLLVRPLMNALRLVCEDLGGRVPAIEGDGFMAVFGALAADPQDPQRASVAAGTMQRLVQDRRQTYGSALSLRVGLHVGEVLVAPSWERHGFAVSGDVVNVASRLCGAARPSEVLVSRDLCALLPDVVATEPRSLQLRNRSEDVEVLSLVWSDAEKASASALRPVLGQLVGRQAELEWLASASRDECLLVIGDSGVGKSRLVSEWLTGGPDLVLSSRCSSFEVTSERAVLRDLLMAIPDTADDEISALVASARHLAAAGDEDLVSVEQLVEAVADCVLARATRQPTTVLLDDVQWATSTVRALVDRLLVSPGRPRLVLVSRTPVDWLSSPATLHVLPLEEAHVLTLVESLLPGCPEAVGRLLVERSGGLPLFVEQCVDMLLEDGTVQYIEGACTLVAPGGLKRIPTAMRLFVSARLDLLRERERRVLLTAAVLGDRVDGRLLAALQPDAEAAVEELVERGLMRREEPQGSGSLAFSHALVRDVAYASQLRRTRRDIHCAAADWYGILPARELLEARAKHLRAALDLVSSPDCQLTVDTVLAMTTWAQSIVAERPAEAVGILEDIFHIDDQLPQCHLPMLDARLAAATGYELMGREADATLQARLAAPLAAERGDAAARAQVALLEGRSLVLSAPHAAEARLRDAMTWFEEAGDRPGAARAGVERAIILEPQEGLMPVLRAHEEAYRVGLQTGDKRLLAHAAQQLAFFWSMRSRRDSTQWVDRATTASRSDDVAGAATVLLADAAGCMLTMQWAQGAALAQEAVDVAQTCGADFVIRNAVMVAVECSVHLGDLERGAELLATLEGMAPARPNARLRQTALGHRAMLAARQGEAVQADEALMAAMATDAASEQVYARFNEFVAAQVLMERGAFVEAERRALAAYALDELLDQPLEALAARLLVLRARVAAGHRISLHEGLALPREAEERGAPALATVARQWLRLDDVLRGEVDTELPAEPCDLAESRALHLETVALREREPELLLEAAEEWSRLGATIWPARALSWHTELAGETHPEVADILRAVGAGPDRAEYFAAQVRGR
ncbi:MAG: adenylate/guanylate cyclase domain-containing protein [Mycobacteriales bacterium]